jgi:hypothetical protein
MALDHLLAGILAGNMSGNQSKRLEIRSMKQLLEEPKVRE